MLTVRSNRGGLVGVRLSEIPVAVRRRRGRKLLEDAWADQDLKTAVALTQAIESPSDRIYWVPGDAFRKVIT